MTQATSNSIDYLFEDPPISNQQYALVSIVGPNMKQKCDVWGLKIRGTAENLDRARSLSQKILKIDNNYDIYTVEVGKFFPLQVEPHDIGNVEYQNEQLNLLVKNYLQNKETASDFWHQRKNEMIQEAIREGKSQNELVTKPEHPIAVLQRIQNQEKTIKEMQDNLLELQSNLQLSQEKFSNYTEEERKIAYSTSNPVENVVDEVSVDDTNVNVNVDLNSNIQDVSESHDEVTDIIDKIQLLESELNDTIEFKNSIEETSAPSSAYEKIVNTISDLENEVKTLKEKLNDKELVNNYINESYQNSKYEF